MSKTRLMLFLIVLCAVCHASAWSEGISAAKVTPQSMPVSVTGAVTLVNPLDCYIESENRTGGIWVQGDTSGVQIGDVVTAVGSISMEDGELVVVDAVITPTGGQADIYPFGMQNKWVGGASVGSAKIEDFRQQFGAWVTTGGASNTGLLVKTWGTVTSAYHSAETGARWFYIDDGFGAVSDLGDIGILVYSNADVKLGQFVTVTGVSSVEPSLDEPTRLIRVIRTRTPEDVQVEREPDPAYPFSDEFDLPVMDNRWATAPKVDAGGQSLPAAGTISLASNPGWLTLSFIEDPEHYKAHSEDVIQPMDGDWDLDAKMRMESDLPEGLYQGIVLVLRREPRGRLLQTEVPGIVLAGLVWLGPEQTESMLLTYVADAIPESDGVTFEGNTRYFKLRKRGDTLYGSASDDGADYCDEFTTNCASRRFLAIYAFSLTNDGSYHVMPMTGLMDYIRFSPPSD